VLVAVGVDDAQFQLLFEQVRDLHRLTDELTRESTRIHANVRARLNWDRNPPVLPAEQRKLADQVVEALNTPRLSSRQSEQLFRVYFGR
jgi:hypothetical protein